MSGLRDYQEWHRQYDDPGSGVSWRLRTVQRHLHAALDRCDDRVRILSLCAGDGRDLLQVLAERDDSDRVSATLVELHPGLAEQARTGAAAAQLESVEVLTADAGCTDTYASAVPADIVLLVGIFGNITDADVHQTVQAAPQLCAAGATLLWSRGRQEVDLNDDVRRWFGEAGFNELDYATHDSRSRPALGAMRYDGPPQVLQPGRRLFTFVR